VRQACYRHKHRRRQPRGAAPSWADRPVWSQRSPL